MELLMELFEHFESYYFALWFISFIDNLEVSYFSLYKENLKTIRDKREFIQLFNQSA